MYIHTKEGKKGHEMSSDPMDLTVGYNPNFDLLVKDIWASFFCFFGFYYNVCHLLPILWPVKLSEINTESGSI